MGPPALALELGQSPALAPKHAGGRRPITTTATSTCASPLDLRCAAVVGGSLPSLEDRLRHRERERSAERLDGPPGGLRDGARHEGEVPLHPPGLRRHAGAALVHEGLLAGREEGVLAHHRLPTHLVRRVVPVCDDPMAGEQLRGGQRLRRLVCGALLVHRQQREPDAVAKEHFGWITPLWNEQDPRFNFDALSYSNASALAPARIQSNGAAEVFLQVFLLNQPLNRILASRQICRIGFHPS
mmetsp:Transcript_30670/g.66962  ORF Transcript_30670/g.66962 Transcript_30670/m.66962 type:complete len:242 (-) Transcript_30670:985-1710(-)